MTDTETIENMEYRGAAIDTRPQEEKDKDYLAIEIATFSPVNWREKKKSEWRKPPTRNQDGSSTCVGQTDAKILGIENENEEGNFIVFSARDIYQRRENKPYEGMNGVDALKIISNHGATTEDRLPSQNMSEQQIEAPFVRTAEDVAIAQKYKAGGYVQLPVGDIDAIADIIENKKKGVMLFFFADMDEWNRDVPEIKRDIQVYTAKVRHSVTGVDITLYKGKKAIIIDDSWGKFIGLNGQRIITEDFLKKRNYFAGYVLDLKNTRPIDVPPVNKPQYKFNKVLTFNMRNDADVKALQDILKFEQLFPQNVPSTGNFLQITAKAVYAWQVKHNVASMEELRSLAGKRVGPKTIAKLNALYGQ